MISSGNLRLLALGVAISLQIPGILGCGGHRVPDLSRVFAEARNQRGKRPIILVPGILNMNLVNSKTGETVWPSAFRSDDDELALPITGDPLNSTDNLVATKALESARFLPLMPRISFLKDLLIALRTGAGYHDGDWDNPSKDGDRDTFYTFLYDWRRDNVKVAQQLIERISRLKEKLGKPELRFDVVSVSMGGLIARYAAMYGNADLRNDQNPPSLTWAGAAHIDRIFMFAPPNAGSMEAFATVLNGYSITQGAAKPRRLFHKLSREDAFTSLAVFQLMPHRQTVRFLDRDLKPLAIDLYDPVNWKGYGWSIAHDPAFRKRFVMKNAGGEKSPADQNANLLDVHLAATLERTRLFHQALDVPIDGSAPVQLVALAGDCEETLNAVVVYYDQNNNRWVTMTSPRELRASDGHRIRQQEVRSAMYVPGDGRVTRSSVLGTSLEGAPNMESPYKTILPIVHAFFVCGGHGELQNNPMLENNALTLLLGRR
ncbi:MAG: hypothetical protein ABJA18_00780 [bacterium]